MSRFKVEERACKDCEWRKEKTCNCKYRRRDSATRLCVNAARHEYLKDLKGTILEVGAGVNSLIRSFSLENPEFKYIKHRGYVSNITQADNSIDAVAAGQCLEHWHQRGDTLEAGINEIYRVLKPGGLFYIDVPIHSHGNPIFIEGDLDKIMAKFPEDKWEIVKVEKRRHPYEPLAAIPENKHTPIGSYQYPLVIIAKAVK